MSELSPLSGSEGYAACSDGDEGVLAGAAQAPGHGKHAPLLTVISFHHVARRRITYIHTKEYQIHEPQIS